MKAWIAIFITALFPAAGHAASTYFGKVKNIHAMPNGVVLVHTSNSGTKVGTGPACATVVSRYSFDATTPGGKIMLDIILAAYNKGVEVGIAGSDTCANGWAGEDINYLTTWDPSWQ